MKTTIAASTLILISQIAAAGSWEDVWQNPDLMTGVYDKPVTLTEPVGTSDIRISLHEWYRGNPDNYHGEIEGYVAIGSEQPVVTSLDEFYRGNPDHDHINPVWKESAPSHRGSFAFSF